MFRKYYHKYVLGLSTYPQDIINDTTTEAIFTFNIKFWKKINRKYEVHEVFHELNHYHENITLTIELSPSTKIPNQYKRSNITPDLHQTGNIGSDMNEEIQTICKGFIKADYHKLFVDSLIS